MNERKVDEMRKAKSGMGERLPINTEMNTRESKPQTKLSI